MKKLICVLMALAMLLTLAACGGSGEPAASGENGTEEGTASGADVSGSGQFEVGFAKVDITPDKPVHMASYGDNDTRISESVSHPIYVHTVALRDADGGTVVILTTDLSWGGGKNAMNDIRPMIEERFGLTKDRVMIGGIHNHNAIDYGYPDTNDQEWMVFYQNCMVESVQQALDDLAPAKVEIGRTATKNLTFVRRYLLENGNYKGDNFNMDDNSPIVSHESEADEEVQIVRFVREGEHKDIVMVNWQAHAAKHGHTRSISADYAGPLRDKVEEATGAWCVFYQGACGNLNPTSRIEGECPTGGNGYENAVKHGELVADVVLKALNDGTTMKEINTGRVQVHQENFVTDESFDESNTIACGDLSFVTFPAEFFDCLGKTIKDETPFEMTVLLGFHCGPGQYLPSMEGYLHGGYEVRNTRYTRAGSGERFVEFYLEKLNALYAER